MGSAGFRIDLRVRHPDRPGQYILAVECDGATYHGALWARERDRLRQDVLEGMGWRFHRIWSTDWFYRRSQEIERLRDALEAARKTEGTHFQGSNLEAPTVTEKPETAAPPAEDIALPELEKTVLRVPAYQRADIQVRNSSIPPHEASTESLATVVVHIVEMEGPIHLEETARRVASAFGLQRAGRRIQEATDQAASMACRKGLIVADGRFVMTKDQREKPPVRDRSAEAAPTTRADYLSPIEIRAAAHMIEQESGFVPREELITAVARLLGFARTGQELRSTIASALQENLSEELR